MIRGGVYQVNFGPVRDESAPDYRGHEQRGKRYGVVMSPSDIATSTAFVIPTSASAPPGVHHPEITFDGRPSHALIEQSRSIDVRFIGELVGYLTRDQMADVESALSHYLGLIPDIES